MLRVYGRLVNISRVFRVQTMHRLPPSSPTDHSSRRTELFVTIMFLSNNVLLQSNRTASCVGLRRSTCWRRRREPVHRLYSTKKKKLEYQNLFYRKFSSAKKIRQKRPSGSSSGIYFRQAWVVARLPFGSRSFAFRFSSHSRIFVVHTFGFEKNFSQEFNLVKELVWRKRRK